MKVILYAKPAEDPTASWMEMHKANPLISFTQYEGCKPTFEVEAETAPETKWSNEQDSEETTIKHNGRSLTVGAVLNAIMDRTIAYRVLDADLAAECDKAHNLSL